MFGRRRSLVCLLALVISLAGFPTGVGAHASLVASSPAAGQTVGDVLEHIDLVFDEGVTAVELAVTGPGAKQILVTTAQPVPNHLQVRFDEPLRAEGEYTVMYSLVSADEDPLTFVFRFTYEADAGPALPVLAQAVDTGRATERSRSAVVLVGLFALVVVVSLLTGRYIRLRRELRRR